MIVSSHLAHVILHECIFCDDQNLQSTVEAYTTLLKLKNEELNEVSDSFNS